MMRRWPRGCGGFTLMETAVTIVVLGVIAAVGYEAFTTLIDRRTQIRAAMAETERAAALRATLEGWFARSNLQGPQGAAIPGSGDVGGPDKDMLSLITRAPTPSRGFATVMILFIDDNPSTPERGLAVRYLGYAANEGVPWLTVSNSQVMQTQDSQLRRLGQSPGARQLDSQVVGMRVEYLDQQTNRWVANRTATQIQPVAARVTLIVRPNTPLPPLLRLPFLVTQNDGWQRRP